MLACCFTSSVFVIVLLNTEHYRYETDYRKKDEDYEICVEVKHVSHSTLMMNARYGVVVVIKSTKAAG